MQSHHESIDLDTVPPHQEKRTIEDSIFPELGVTSKAHRSREIRLLIDPCFCDIAELEGNNNPEDLFGPELWTNWLQARAFLKKEKTYSVATIKRAHALLCGGDGESAFRQKSMAGYQYGSDMELLSLSPQEVEAINANPLLEYQVLDSEEQRGMIVYPEPSARGVTQKVLRTLPNERKRRILIEQGKSAVIEALMGELVDWLNEPFRLDKEFYTEYYPNKFHPFMPKERKIAVVAEFQRRLVSIHPFDDLNGTLSHALLADYLEKLGLPPAILENGDKDIFFTEEQWKHEVENGIETSRQIVESGNEFHQFSPEEQTFFSQVFRSIEPPPPLQGKMDHDKARAYVGQLRALFNKGCVPFASPSNRVVLQEEETRPDAEYGLVGGVIPLDYLVNWGRVSPEIQRKHVEEYHLPISIYRGMGVHFTNELQQRDRLLKFFTFPLACTAGYRSVYRHRGDSRSAAIINPDEIRQDMLHYNAVLKRDLAKQSGYPVSDEFSADEMHQLELYLKFLSDVAGSNLTHNIMQSYREGEYLRRLLAIQIEGKGEVGMSPFVSTSVNKETSYTWARKARGNSDIPGAKITSVLLKAALPKYGKFQSDTIRQIPICAHGLDYKYNESEWLLTGGVEPASIQEVIIYDDDTGLPKLTLTRSDDRTNVTMVDHDSKEATTYECTDKGLFVRV